MTAAELIEILSKVPPYAEVDTEIRTITRTQEGGERQSSPKDGSIVGTVGLGIALLHATLNPRVTLLVHTKGR